MRRDRDDAGGRGALLAGGLLVCCRCRWLELLYGGPLPIALSDRIWLVRAAWIAGHKSAIWEA